MTYEDPHHRDVPSDVVRPDALRFSHTDGRERGTATQISSSTRYLSGAAYVDETYAEQVIDELVASSHRAVPPSLGYDTTTVVRHCFRARRLWLIQNAVLTAILLVGALFFRTATVTLFVICLLAAVVLPEAPGRAKWPPWKVVAAIVIVLLAVGCLTGPILGIIGVLNSSPFGSSGFESDSLGEVRSAAGGSGGQVAKFLGGLVLIGGALLATLVWSRHRMITTITSSLRSGHDERFRAVRKAMLGRERADRGQSSHHHDQPAPTLDQHLLGLHEAGLTDAEVAWKVCHTMLVLARRPPAA